VPGIKSVTYANWFGGLYQGEQRNFFPNFAVGPGFLEMYPEYILPPEQLKAFYAERTGAVVGKGLAERHGWKVGDTIPLQATIFPTKDGSNNWEFKLVGIYDMVDEKREGEENQLVFNWQVLRRGQRLHQEPDRLAHGGAGRGCRRQCRGQGHRRALGKLDARNQDPDRAGLQPGLLQACSPTSA
jgi:hypothetical protein